MLRDYASNEPIYAAGCKLSITLSHNGHGNQAVLLYGMRLNVRNFQAGDRPDFKYLIEGDLVHPAGSAMPHEFVASIDGEQVLPARWVLEGTPRRYAVATSWNFFDIPRYPRVVLAPGGEHVEEITGHILASRVGEYEVSITFLYSVAGEDRQQETTGLRIYVAP